MRRRIGIIVAAAATLGALALPATATVHEITGMFCAGEHGNHTPNGISGGSKANNFAQPLIATGFVESIAPYDGDGVNGPGVLITFDLDHPASKIAPHPTLDTFFVGNGTYITAFVLDSSHGFSNCKELRSP
ncbi:MAG TPA: hypothetical protein VMS74_08590 [Acidimicrobiia bacterium]|nr:hypothetical protein [Acidimicrobiia bacterium]